MLEKEIEKRVCDHAKAKGMLVYKFSSPGHRAVPDRMFVVPMGNIFFVEFKSPGNKPTPQQEREHFRLAAHGVRVYWTDNIEQGIAILEKEIGDARGVT
jgi:hypothetical protein